MFLIPFRRGPTGFSSDVKEQIPDRKLKSCPAPVSTLFSPSRLLFLTSIQRAVSPSLVFLFQQAFTRGKGIKLFPGLRRRAPTFQNLWNVTKSVIVVKCWVVEIKMILGIVKGLYDSWGVDSLNRPTSGLFSHSTYKCLAAVGTYCCGPVRMSSLKL